MTTDYNKFAKTFSNSRKNMKWEEISYFLDVIKNSNNQNEKYDEINILDIGCWNGRLLWELRDREVDINSYLWIDLSKWLLKEAKKNHPNDNFLELNMLDLNKLIENISTKSFSPFNIFFSSFNNFKKEKFYSLQFSHIFFIASFHHLKTIQERIEVLKTTYKLLTKWWYIYMTNWSLNSKLNYEKYKKIS